jgi:8-oxo-dGTP pyrophosphatase MutT (NUDIX family)
VIESKVGATCIVVLGEDGLVLAVSRKDDPRDFGLPGGKMEPGETVEDCARRELEEETGVHAQKLVSIFVGPARTPGRLCEGFFALYFGNAPRLRERGAIGWVPWSVLFEGSFGDYNRKLKAALDARPLCSTLQPEDKISYVDSMGNRRLGRVVRVTQFQVRVALTDDIPGECDFDYDEVDRLVKEGP